ncbi:hypothetical protein [Chthoniobacter flavus]|uniref:hypothetical protein n=1 Tax=Chthoniobacter flavus TaxID=191863 RepID=UPI0012FAD452|nr:hypothetical protein [Chthoniobacter flavus]
MTAIVALLWFLLHYQHWPFPFVLLVSYIPMLLLRRWCERTPGYPTPKPLSWRSWGLWIFLTWAGFIFISGFYLSPEHHRHIWIPFFWILGIGFVLSEIRKFWIAGKLVREVAAPAGTL